MDIEEKFGLITKDLEECLVERDLMNMLKVGFPLKHYIGFEISGKVHLGTGLMSGKHVANFQKAGVNCSYFLASWHAWINNKFGGDLEKIRKAANYFEEALKIGLEIMGGDPDKAKFVHADELYHNNDTYMQLVIDIAKNMTLSRALRSITIMGRKEGEATELASLFYPAMQVADIYVQGLNLAHAGMDQRKAHVIAREVAKKVKIKPLEYKNKRYSPVALHHHLLLGLQKPKVWPVPKNKMQELWSEMKMSKSVPGSAIFVHDREEEIIKKMKNAFCPPKVVDFNPVLDWAKNLIFISNKSCLKIERNKKFGGDLEYIDYKILEKDFSNGELHPLDLKNGIGLYLAKMLEPARKKFKKPKYAKMKNIVDSLVVTR